ncbi:hypothetical protein ACWGJP_01590 [Microbacterium sp. NPDC055903]
MLSIPLHARIDGVDVTIERVWPAKRTGEPVSLEARADGLLRGGHAHADGTMSLLAPGHDQRLPALGTVADAGTLVAHRPGRRAVVRLSDGRGFAKIVRPGKASDVIAAHRRALAFGAGFALASPIAHEFDPDQVVVFETLEGRSLSDGGSDRALPDAQWQRAWEAWADGWLATMAAADPSGLPVHDVEDERRVIRTWAAHAVDALGHADEILAAASAASSALSAAGPATALSHRDLHDAQLLWDPQAGMGMIDLDTCARADPALDLGNLAAHADFAHAQGRWSASRAAIATATIARTASALGIDAARWDAWRTAARFRVACVNALRPRWREVAGRELTGFRTTFAAAP